MNQKPAVLVFLASAKMALATFISRILGLVREQVLAAQFGASGVTDAFLVAFRIPNLLRDLFAEGAFSSAFVPVFTEVHAKDPAKAREMLWSLFCLLGLITGVLSGLCILFAPNIVALFVSKSFEQDQEKFRLTVLMTQVMSPFLLFVSLAALMMGALNTLKSFFLPALAPALYNLCMISSMLWLPPVCERYGFPVALSLAAGVSLGGLAQMLLQWGPLIKKGFGPVRFKSLLNATSRRVVALMSLGIIGFGGTQLNLLVTTFLATTTAVGAVSWLGFGFRLFQFPVGILGVSLAGSNLVHFSEAIKKGDQSRAVETLRASYSMSFLVILPTLSLMLPQTHSIVHVVFERGLFGSFQTTQTALAFHWYLLGLPFYALYKLLSPSFYALGKQKIPIYCSLFSVLFNILFCWFLVPVYGFEVLALGTSLSMLLNTCAQCYLMARCLELKWDFFVNLRLLKFAGAAVVAGWLCFRLNRQWFDSGLDLWREVLVLACVSLISALCYGGFLLLFGEGKTLLMHWNKGSNKPK